MVEERQQVIRKSWRKEPPSTSSGNRVGNSDRSSEFLYGIFILREASALMPAAVILHNSSEGKHNTNVFQTANA